MEKPVGTFDKHCYLECGLASPDGNSARTLYLMETDCYMGPRSMYGKILHTWHKGHEPMLEAYLAERGVYPEW